MVHAWRCGRRFLFAVLTVEYLSLEVITRDSGPFRTTSRRCRQESCSTLGPCGKFWHLPTSVRTEGRYGKALEASQSMDSRIRGEGSFRGCSVRTRPACQWFYWLGGIRSPHHLYLFQNLYFSYLYLLLRYISTKLHFCCCPMRLKYCWIICNLLLSEQQMRSLGHGRRK